MFMKLEIVQIDFNQKINDVNGNFSRQQFDEIWPRLRVLARSSPQDKYVLVNGILESKLNPNREVVAVTGMLNIFIFSLIEISKSCTIFCLRKGIIPLVEGCVHCSPKLERLSFP